jgi:cytosine/adenosine deaminase-related metal-dependent hydrolase
MSDSTIHTSAWLINPDTPPLSHGSILIHNGIIRDTGTRDELKSRYNAPVIEHPDCAILPGFVNAHTHLELTHFPSWRIRSNVDYNPRSFTDWIIQLIKICRGLKTDDFRASLAEGLRICAESGTTSVGDIVTRYDLLPVSGVPPIGGTFFLELLGNDPALFDIRIEKALSTADRFTAEGLTPGLSPHAPYSTADRNMALVRDAAALHSLPLAVHISESREETDFIYDARGPLAERFYPFVNWEQFLPPPRHCSSTVLLDRHGLLTPATLAIHCVHLSPADARIIKERGSSICLCPRSNDCLDVGVAPVALYKKLGIPMALGTDSLASNNSLSMWDEMRFALDVFARDLSPEDVFRMATIGGAAALGRADAIGSLEPGKRADFQVVRNIGNEPNGLLERIIGQGRISAVSINGIIDSGCHSG